MSKAGEHDQDQMKAALPRVWVRAHPFGSKKVRDASKQYFDRVTDFHDRLLTSIPVSYYHNRTDDFEPNGAPVAIGKTVARKYRPDGRWDKIEFFDEIPQDIRATLVDALENGTLRASPTVVPDFHEVESNGHIRDWLAGSIAVMNTRNGHIPRRSTPSRRPK